MISPQERQAYAEVLLGCNGIERQLAFNANQTILTDWTFLFFDEPAAKISTPLKKKTFVAEGGKMRYSILPLGNYEHLWVVGTATQQTEVSLQCYLSAELDLNIWTYLSNYVIDGRTPPNDPNGKEFLKFLRYLKDEKNQINLSILASYIERRATSHNSRKYGEMIQAFVTFADSDYNCIQEKWESRPLKEESYNRMKEIYETEEPSEEISRIVKAIKCLLLKTFLLKFDGQLHSPQQKFDELVRFSDQKLGIMLEQELILCNWWIQNDKRIRLFTKKFQPSNKKILENIRHSAWDITHIRLAEKVLANDSFDTRVAMPAIVTADVGLIEIIEANPIVVHARRADGVFFSKRKHSFEEIKSEALVKSMEQSRVDQRNRQPPSVPHLKSVYQNLVNNFTLNNP